MARFLDCKHICAVSNSGYYAMSNMRYDRKLKTSLDAFWSENEGTACSNRRFYEMPIEEYKKSMEELKPSKRLQHRNRFAKLDEITAATAKSFSAYTIV